MGCKIKDLENILAKLNEIEAVSKGIPPYDKDNWHSFFTQGAHVVRQVWVKELLSGKAISRDKAMKLLAAINARLVAAGLQAYTPNTVIVEN